MQHIPVLHLDEATFGRANRLSCRFVVTYSYYAPQKNEKVVSLWHFFATDISTAQTPGALVGAIAAMYHQAQTTFLFFV